MTTKDDISKERVEPLRIFLETTIKDREKVGRNVALPYYRALLRILDDYSKVKSECERLKQKWVDSMGDHVAVSVEAEELQARAEKAEAKLAELKDDLLDAQGDVASAKAQADSFAKIANEKEAELEKVRLDFANMIVSANELADKYETARPLIEAVGRMKTKQLSRAGVWFATREDKNTILRAALAYKKRSQPNE